MRFLFPARPMIRTLASAVTAAAVLVAGSGCADSLTDPSAGDIARLEVRVAGGLGNVDYTYQVSGAGHVTGLECTRGCAFTAGDTILRLTPSQRAAFLDAVERSGLANAEPEVEYGTACCDLLIFHVTYQAGEETRVFSGSMETFPAPLDTLMETVHGLYLGIAPVTLNQDGGLAGFPTDPVVVDSAWVEGPETLAVAVRHGGGCAPHDFDAVVWTGWMESDPVKVGIALAHDGHDDPCDALLIHTLRFGLAPLRQAYADAYGAGPATVVLQVQAAESGQVVEVPFSF